MAKLIKKGSPELEHLGGDDDTASELSALRKAPIIDRNSYEARADGQQIRERAAQQAEEIRAKAQAEAEEIRTTSQAEAEALLEQARSEAETLKSEAHAQGYKEGKEEGVAELTELVTRSSLRMQEIEAQIVPQLTELAISIARKVLGKELEFHPEAVVQIVKQALSEKARQRREVSLRVHPDDLQMIREHKGELLEILSRTKEIGIREDPNVARHGVVIETDAGTIDAQLETQLAAFEKVMQDIR